jgi:hypothetical protein
MVLPPITEQTVSIILFTLMIVALPVVTAGRYLWAGWPTKRDDIMNSIDDASRKSYLEKFLRKNFDTPEKASNEFYKIYHKRFGRRHYTAPLFLFIVLITWQAIYVSQTVLFMLNSNWKPTLSLPPIALSAMAGAYMWVVSDFVWRSRRLDLSPSDVLWATLRLFIATAMGYSFASLLKEDLGPFIAFSLGAFPLTALTVGLRKLANKYLNLDIGPTDTAGQLMKLEGVDGAIAERLANEDMTTIAQLAYCDPVQLTMRTNLLFNFVIDIVSQALARMYFEEKLDALRPLGLRGAYEINIFLDDLKGEAGLKENASDADRKEAEADRQVAEAVLAKVASAMGLDNKAVKYPLLQVGEDPYTAFLCDIWVRV